MRLLLDSRFAIKNTNDNTYKFILPDRIKIGPQIKLVHAMIGNTHFNIMQNMNDKLDFTYTLNGVTQNYTFTISFGNYSSSQLVTNIQNQINSVYGSNFINVTYNSNTYQFIFALIPWEFGGSISFNFLSGTNNKTSIANVLGFQNKDYTGSTLSSDLVPDLNSPNYVLIDIVECDAALKTNTSKYDNSYVYWISFENAKGSVQSYYENKGCQQIATIRSDYYVELNIGLYVVMASNTQTMNIDNSYTSSYPFMLVLEY
jgi:hypothetical protein